MGANQSVTPVTTQSYLQYKNDFELVIRATKDLEHLLETQFGAPSSKEDGLHDKITHAQESADLSKETVNKMRYLVTIRDSLVHDHRFNKLPDRRKFALIYDSVEEELKEVLAKRGQIMAMQMMCVSFVEDIVEDVSHLCGVGVCGFLDRLLVIHKSV